MTAIPLPQVFDPEGNTVVQVYDYEAPPETLLTYRARGFTVVGGGLNAGDWSADSNMCAWAIDTDTSTCEGTQAWLKNPVDPTQNRLVVLGQGSLMTKTKAIGRGVFDILGRENAIAVTDVRHSVRTDVSIITQTVIEAADVEDLFDAAVTLLLQCPSVFGWLSEYVSAGDLTETRPIAEIAKPERVFSTSLVVVDSPITP